MSHAPVPEYDTASWRTDLERCDSGLDLCHQCIVELRVAAWVELVAVCIIEQAMCPWPDREPATSVLHRVEVCHAVEHLRAAIVVRAERLADRFIWQIPVPAVRPHTVYTPRPGRWADTPPD